MRTVKEIVKQYLIDHGYDGLYSDAGECGCDLANLLDCDMAGTGQCKPGYKVEDPSDGFEYLIAPKNDVERRLPVEQLALGVWGVG